jgi:hypothetical protein
MKVLMHALAARSFVRGLELRPKGAGWVLLLCSHKYIVVQISLLKGLCERFCGPLISIDNH